MNVVIGFLAYAAATVGWDVTWHRGCNIVTIVDLHGRKWELEIRPCK